MADRKSKDMYPRVKQLFYFDYSKFGYLIKYCHSKVLTNSSMDELVTTKMGELQKISVKSVGGNTFLYVFIFIRHYVDMAVFLCCVINMFCDVLVYHKTLYQIFVVVVSNGSTYTIMFEKHQWVLVSVRVRRIVTALYYIIIRCKSCRYMLSGL